VQGAPQNTAPPQSSAPAFVIEPAAPPAAPVQNFDNAFTIEPIAPAAPAAAPVPPSAAQGFDPFEFGTQPPAAMNSAMNFQPQSFTPPPAPAAGFQPAEAALSSGGRSELDLEIEKYQREIEEKQKKMRAAGTPQGAQQWPDSQEMQSYSNPADQNRYQSQQSYAAEPQVSADADYNMTADGSPSDDEVFFTSVDMKNQKKPVKRPVNPIKMKEQQKGFIQKLFNKDNMQ
jgi:hypothetical protein